MDNPETPALTDLVRQAQQGREPAQRSLILAYQNRVAGFIYTITGKSDSVDDLTQTVFIKMIRALPQLDQVSQFEAWLFRLAKNTCIDHLRRAKWQRLFSPLEQETHAEIPDTPTSVDTEELDALRHALSIEAKRSGPSRACSGRLQPNRNGRSDRHQRCRFEGQIAPRT
jgi:RNA polymerase sigma-70 factor, ECF subfamily